MIGRRFWGLGVVAAVALACASLAAAGKTGGSRDRVARLGRGAEWPALGVDARGDQTVGWTEQVGTQSGQDFWIVAATRPAGKRWRAPVRLSHAGENPVAPVVAVDPSGAAVIAWIEAVPGRYTFRSVVVARTRPSASAPWQPTVRVASATGSLVGLQARIDARGEATLIWSGSGTRRSPVMSVTGSTAAGRWRRAHRLGQLGVGVLAPQLAVNGRGDAVVAWARGIGSTRRGQVSTIHYVEQVRIRPAGGGWGRPFVLARLSQPDYIGANVWTPPTPDLALDDRGDATVMWRTIRSSGTAVLVAHRSARTGRWSQAHLLAPNAGGPVIATDARGHLVAAWTAQRGRLFVTQSRDGITWSHPAVVSGDAANLTSLSVGQDGNAILAWYASPATVFVSVRRRAGGRWTKPAEIGHGVLPAAEVAGTGRAAIIWLHLGRPKLIDVIYATTYPTG